MAIISVAAVLAGGFISQAQASQITATLSPNHDFGKVKFYAQRFVTIKPAHGLIDGPAFTSKVIKFDLKGNVDNIPDVNGINSVIKTINSALLNSAKSQIVIKNATLSYYGELRYDRTADQITARIDVTFQPTVERFVLLKGDNGRLIDLEWRKAIVNDPLIVNTKDYGKVNVNYPIGLFQIVFPALGDKLLNSEAKEILTAPIFNFNEFEIPMEKWHYLFDDTGESAGASKLYLEKDTLAREAGQQGVSLYSFGETTFPEGTLKQKFQDAGATIDGKTVNVHSYSPLPSAQIGIIDSNIVFTPEFPLHSVGVATAIIGIVIFLSRISFVITRKP